MELDKATIVAIEMFISYSVFWGPTIKWSIADVAIIFFPRKRRRERGEKAGNH